jgi:hypothetical protein
VTPSVMASSDAHLAADAVLMALEALQVRKPDALGHVVALVYADLSAAPTADRAGLLAAEAMAGHLELGLLLLTRLVELTGQQPDQLLRDALRE